MTICSPSSGRSIRKVFPNLYFSCSGHDMDGFPASRGRVSKLL